MCTKAQLKNVNRSETTKTGIYYFPSDKMVHTGNEMSLYPEFQTDMSFFKFWFHSPLMCIIGTL